jgi:hypothetical protein
MLPIDVKPLVYYPLSQLMPATLHGALVTSSPEDVPTFKEKLLMDGSPSTPIMASALRSRAKTTCAFQVVILRLLMPEHYRSVQVIFAQWLTEKLKQPPMLGWA